ncbi:MAG: TM1802 family CRISPR-associated protein, partial [Nitrososphaerales archaeon]
MLEIGRLNKDGGSSVDHYYSLSKSFGKAEVFVVRTKLLASKDPVLAPIEIEKIEFSREENASNFLYTDREIERSKPNATKLLATSQIHAAKPLSGVKMAVDFAFKALDIEPRSEAKFKLVSWIDERIKYLLTRTPPQELRENKFLVTLKIEEEIGDEGKKRTRYLAQYESARRILSKGFVPATGAIHICAVCNQREKITQYNFLGLYTLDRPGFAPHGNKEFGGTLFPVCESCRDAIICAERWISEYASFRLYDGINYFFLPVIDYPLPNSTDYSKGVEHFLSLLQDT